MIGIGRMAGLLRDNINWADLNPVIGSQPGGLRPVLVLSHNVFNERTGTVIAVALTSQVQRAGLEKNPDWKRKIKKVPGIPRGRAFGKSRVICNAHWQSDVIEGRLAGAAAVARLHAEPAFREALEAAKIEQRRPLCLALQRKYIFWRLMKYQAGP